jgi:hypothetical protein
MAIKEEDVLASALRGTGQVTGTSRAVVDWRLNFCLLLSGPEDAAGASE